MYNTYTQRKNQNKISEGKVMESSSSGLTIFSNIELENPSQVLPYGYYSKPCQGDKVLVIHSNDGKYSVAGVILAEQSLSDGEVLISSSGGAYIKLRSDGKIEANGMIISTSGNIE